MASTVYKGDLAEVTFGHECGLALKHGSMGGGGVATYATSPTSLGSGYTAATKATSGGSGSSATVAVASILSGVALSFEISISGTGETAGSTAKTQADASASTGSGTALSIKFDSIDTEGAVLSATLLAGGIGHAVNDVITLPNAGGVAVKVKVLSIANGQLGTITAASPADGTGYNVGDVLTVAGGTGGTVTVATLIAPGLTMTKATNSANADCTDITFGGAVAGFFDSSGNLKYPAGMLVGSTLRVRGSSTPFLGDDYATTGNTYTIVSNTAKVITVTPLMKANGASGDNDEILIDGIGTPTCDTGMSFNASAKLSDESVLTDQFVGLAATVALPETKIEIRRSHVVGLGRDVVVQEPQSMKNEGGAIEMMMNSARWLYYALGAQVVNEPSAAKATFSTDGAESDIAAGDVYFEYTGTASNPPTAGEYLLIVDATAVEFPTDRAVAADNKKWGNLNGGSVDGLGTDMENAERNEIRRVIHIDASSDPRRIYVDEPFTFDHAIANMTQKVVAYHDSSTNGSPHFDTAAATYGAITNRQSRLIFEGATVPSFTLESSMRTRNTGSFNASGESEAAPGSASDNKQLTRVWRGCKVKDFSLAADADAEVKLSVNFDALYCYTDTGRLEDTTPANKGDRYTAHRMFENIANSGINRKKAGIAPNTEKPYFFYNGSISAFGINIAQITNFNLTGNNNIENFLTVRGSSFKESRNSLGQSLEQVPFGGSRNPNLSVEKTVEYELKMAIIVSDPLLWHEYRTNRVHGYTEPITLTLTKAGAGANREQIIVVIDDYIISEAPLPIPEDKGVIKSEMTIMPKHVRVISHDAFLGL
tara:strand:- start:12248 stop:14728 length:2481 start_codon:yes stop_codon:yes gene_type:complete